MKKHLPITYLLFILLGLSIVYAGIAHYSVEGYVEVDVLKIDGNIITIGSGCRAIIADTSPERAYAIQMGIEERIEGRPLTHDTFNQVLTGFNITLEAVKLQTFDDKYYYSDMILSDNEKILVLDAMPSDAIAMALRSDAPIYINQTLLAEIGQDIC